MDLITNFFGIMIALVTAGVSYGVQSQMISDLKRRVKDSEDDTKELFGRMNKAESDVVAINVKLDSILSGIDAMRADVRAIRKLPPV